MATTTVEKKVEKHGIFQEFVEDVLEDAKSTKPVDESKSLAYLQKIGMDDGFADRLQELEEDKAEREDEWLDDMMQYERAGTVH